MDQGPKGGHNAPKDVYVPRYRRVTADRHEKDKVSREQERVCSSEQEKSKKKGRMREQVGSNEQDTNRRRTTTIKEQGKGGGEKALGKNGLNRKEKGRTRAKHSERAEQSHHPSRNDESKDIQKTSREKKPGAQGARVRSKPEQHKYIRSSETVSYAKNDTLSKEGGTGKDVVVDRKKQMRRKNKELKGPKKQESNDQSGGLKSSSKSAAGAKDGETNREGLNEKPAQVLQKIGERQKENDWEKTETKNANLTKNRNDGRKDVERSMTKQNLVHRRNSMVWKPKGRGPAESENAGVVGQTGSSDTTMTEAGIEDELVHALGKGGRQKVPEQTTNTPKGKSDDINESLGQPTPTEANTATASTMKGEKPGVNKGGRVRAGQNDSNTVQVDQDAEGAKSVLRTSTDLVHDGEGDRADQKPSREVDEPARKTYTAKLEKRPECKGTQDHEEVSAKRKSRIEGDKPTGENAAEPTSWQQGERHQAVVEDDEAKRSILGIMDAEAQSSGRPNQRYVGSVEKGTHQKVESDTAENASVKYNHKIKTGQRPKPRGQNWTGLRKQQEEGSASIKPRHPIQETSVKGVSTNIPLDGEDSSVKADIMFLTGSLSQGQTEPETIGNRIPIAKSEKPQPAKLEQIHAKMQSRTGSKNSGDKAVTDEPSSSSKARNEVEGKQEQCLNNSRLSSNGSHINKNIAATTTTTTTTIINNNSNTSGNSNNNNKRSNNSNTRERPKTDFSTSGEPTRLSSYPTHSNKPFENASTSALRSNTTANAIAKDYVSAASKNTETLRNARRERAPGEPSNIGKSQLNVDFGQNRSAQYRNKSRSNMGDESDCRREVKSLEVHFDTQSASENLSKTQDESMLDQSFSKKAAAALLPSLHEETPRSTAAVQTSERGRENARGTKSEGKSRRRKTLKKQQGSSVPQPAECLQPQQQGGQTEVHEGGYGQSPQKVRQVNEEEQERQQQKQQQEQQQQQERQQRKQSARAAPEHTSGFTAVKNVPPSSPPTTSEDRDEVKQTHDSSEGCSEGGVDVLPQRNRAEERRRRQQKRESRMRARSTESSKLAKSPARGARESKTETHVDVDVGITAPGRSEHLEKSEEDLGTTKLNTESVTRDGDRGSERKDSVLSGKNNSGAEAEGNEEAQGRQNDKDTESKIMGQDTRTEHTERDKHSEVCEHNKDTRVGDDEHENIVDGSTSQKSRINEHGGEIQNRQETDSSTLKGENKGEACVNLSADTVKSEGANRRPKRSGDGLEDICEVAVARSDVRTRPMFDAEPASKHGVSLEGIEEFCTPLTRGEHVLEVTGFPSDLPLYYKENMLDPIRDVGGEISLAQAALSKFSPPVPSSSSSSHGSSAALSLLQVRPFSAARQETRAVACSFGIPAPRRPQTDSSAAQRMISHSLGLRRRGRSKEAREEATTASEGKGEKQKQGQQEGQDEGLEDRRGVSGAVVGNRQGHKPRTPHAASIKPEKKTPSRSRSDGRGRRKRTPPRQQQQQQQQQQQRQKQGGREGVGVGVEGGKVKRQGSKSRAHAPSNGGVLSRSDAGGVQDEREDKPTDESLRSQKAQAKPRRSLDTSSVPVGIFKAALEHATRATALRPDITSKSGDTASTSVARDTHKDMESDAETHTKVNPGDPAAIARPQVTVSKEEGADTGELDLSKGEKRVEQVLGENKHSQEFNREASGPSSKSSTAEENSSRDRSFDAPRTESANHSNGEVQTCINCHPTAQRERRRVRERAVYSAREKFSSRAQASAKATTADITALCPSHSPITSSGSSELIETKTQITSAGDEKENAQPEAQHENLKQAEDIAQETERTRVPEGDDANPGSTPKDAKPGPTRRRRDEQQFYTVRRQRSITPQGED